MFHGCIAVTIHPTWETPLRSGYTRAMLRRLLQIVRCMLWILCGLGLASCNSDVLEIRIGSHVPELSTGIRTVIKPWIEAVSADLPPHIRFKAYWGGSLGRDAFAQYDLVTHGVLDIAWVIPSYTPGQFPQIDALQLPFLARNSEEASVAGWRLHAQGQLSGVDKIEVLGVWATDVAGLQTQSPLRNLAAVASLKIRSAGAVQADFVSALGANPETMSAVEMNEALQRGALDGVLQAWTGIRTYRTDRLMRAALEGPFGALPFMLVMNKARFQALPANVRESMLRHGGENLAQRAGRAYDAMAVDIRKEAVASGRYEISYLSEAEIDRQTALKEALHNDWIRQTVGGAEAYAGIAATLTELRE